MFDLHPCVFPLGIFILCTWQWAAGRPLLWAQGEGVGALLGLLGKAGLQNGQRGQLGSEEQG